MTPSVCHRMITMDMVEVLYIQSRGARSSLDYNRGNQPCSIQTFNLDERQIKDADNVQALCDTITKSLDI
jgi:hypothetical protein